MNPYVECNSCIYHQPQNRLRSTWAMKEKPVNVIKVVTLGSDGSRARCGGGNCPTLFVTDDGNVLIQGYTMSSDDKNGLEIPSGEDIISMPISALETLVKNFNNEQ